MSSPRKKDLLHRLFRWLLGGVLVVVVLLLIAAAVIKSYDRPDEALSPLARSMLENARTDVADRDNGFVALMGITAPSGKDMVEEGRRYIDLVTPIADRQESTPPFDEQWNGEALTWVGELKPVCQEFSSCRPIDGEGIARLQAQIDVFQRDNTELLERVRRMLAMPAFVPRGSLSYMMPLPGYQNISKFIGLRRAQAALSITHGDFSTALALLEDNQRDMRRLLKEHGTLISDMIAIGMMVRDLHVISAIINDPRLNIEKDDKRLGNLLMPLSAEERNMAPALVQEFRGQAALMRQLGEGDFWGRLWYRISPAYKPVATINEFAEWAEAARHMAGMPPRRFLLERQKHQQHMVEMVAQDGDGGIEMSWRDWLRYNSIGEALLWIAVPAYDDFSACVFDLDAYLALVRAQRALRQAGISSNAVPAFLQAHNDMLTNPWTDEPFTWDADRDTLSFSLRGKSSPYASKEKAEVPVRIKE